MKTILVTGGNGFIGSHVVDKLANEDCLIKCLVRKTSRVDYIQPHIDSKKVELVFGDITDQTSLDKALEGIDTVYHFVAIAGKQNVPKEEYEKINYQGTKDLVDLSIKHGIKKFIYCSSVGVMGNIRQIPADENTPYNPTNEYERTKMLAEQYILEKIKNNNFPAVIIRPAIVYGPRNISNMSRMFKAIQDGGYKFFIIGDGNNCWHLSYATDVASGFVLAGNSEKAIGQIYIIAGEEPVTMNNMTAIAAGILNVAPPKHLPYSLIITAAYCLLLLKKLFKIKVPIEPSGVHFLTNHRAYNISKARVDLNYCPEVNIEKGLKNTLAWYQEHGIL
ncbi:MAG: NAD(P)-dependent oxidoreductase [Patescibacteria group bacterium]